MSLLKYTHWKSFSINHPCQKLPMKMIMKVTFILGMVFTAPDIRYFLKKHVVKKVPKPKFSGCSPSHWSCAGLIQSIILYYYTQCVFHK